MTGKSQHLQASPDNAVQPLSACVTRRSIPKQNQGSWPEVYSVLSASSCWIGLLKKHGAGDRDEGSGHGPPHTVPYPLGGVTREMMKNLPLLVLVLLVVQWLSRVWLFATPWTAACQAPPSYPIPQSLLKLMSIELMMPSNILSSAVPFSSCLQSFPESGSFPMSWLFASGGQSIGASSSVLPVNIQGWFPLGLTGLISL